MAEDDDERRGEEADETCFDAHRPASPDPERAAKVGSTRAAAEAALGDLARQIAGGGEDEGGDQLDLLQDEDLPLFDGPVRHVAKTMKAARGRGRPAGSKNKANQLFRDTLMKMGYRHPGLNLAAMANADPGRLAAELGCKALDAAELIRKANAELLPYFESKRPTEVNVTKRELGVFIMGEMPAAAGDDDEGYIDVTNAAEPDPTKSGT